MAVTHTHTHTHTQTPHTTTHTGRERESVGEREQQPLAIFISLILCCRCHTHNTRPCSAFLFPSAVNVKAYVGGGGCQEILLIITHYCSLLHVSLPYAQSEDPKLLLVFHKGELSSNAVAEANLKITERCHVANVADSHHHRVIFCAVCFKTRLRPTDRVKPSGRKLIKGTFPFKAKTAYGSGSTHI